ncbi:heptaprenyl diphosphate synthase component 1 [Paenibacillus chartarius]|uniref:Heptaprenyl diphosphate synthase component 1 n=1 Tax=Paenibacillus chartarius TaxID=747481 RepID=A0ABV6DQC2_9BACL
MKYRIPEIAKKYTDYDMIQKHTELPEFPEYRTRLLFAFLNGQERIQESSELFTLVTSLVQLGLDTHDMVTVTNDLKEKKAARSRQLKVLAGDYFSSRFYHLLSQAGQIELIRTMSGAICEVNRLKMNLYMMMKQLKVSADDYFRQSVAIRSRLFLSFGSLMDEGAGKLWPEVLDRFIRCEVLIEELFKAEAMEHFRGSWGYWHIMHNGTKEERRALQSDEPDANKMRALVLKHNVQPQLFAMLESAVAAWHAVLGQIGQGKLADELRVCTDTFARMLNKPRAIEEI